MDRVSGGIMAFEFPPVGVIYEYSSDIEPKVLQKTVHALPENNLKWLCGRNCGDDIVDDGELLSLMLDLRFTQFPFGSVNNKPFKCEKVIFAVEYPATLLPYPLFRYHSHI